MQGKLFTQDFLREGIQETDAWQRLDADELTRFRARIAAIFSAFPADSQADTTVAADCAAADQLSARPDVWAAAAGPNTSYSAGAASAA